MITRGIRNNNPFNLVHSSSKWIGLSKNQTDSKFCQFSNVYYGLRAGVGTLVTYITKYHLLSVSEIVSRFAPSSENDTGTYTQFVISQLPDDISPFLSLPCKPDYFCDWLYSISKSICSYESGYHFDETMFFDILKTNFSKRLVQYNILPYSYFER